MTSDTNFDIGVSLSILIATIKELIIFGFSDDNIGHLNTGLTPTEKRSEEGGGSAPKVAPLDMVHGVRSQYRQEAF